jgi:hypothetical protein
MERVNGNQVWDLRAIYMKETISMIRNMASVFLHGQVAIFIKENTKKMREMVMVR